MEAFAGIIALLAFVVPFGGGGVQNDIVSFLDPNDYFLTRRIEGGAKNMLELAAKPSPNAQGSLSQLLALRWLADNKDKLSDQADAVRKAITELSKGPEGFAKDYALNALAKLDGKPAPILHTLPKDSLRKQAFEWFPDDLSLFGAFDIRPPAGAKPLAEKDQPLLEQTRRLQNELMKKMPEEAKEQMYKLAEQVGNIRIDRVAGGYVQGADSKKSKIFVRFTGLANHKYVADALAVLIPDTKSEERKGQEGERITLIIPKHPPAFALIGDTELLMCGYEGNNEDSIKVLEEALEVRAGKKPSLLKTPFGKDLEAAPADASAVGHGIIPAELQGFLAMTPLNPLPLRIAIHIVNGNWTGKGVAFQFRGTMTSEDDAKKLAEGAKGLIKQGIDELKNVPPGFKPEWADTMKKILESIEIKAEKSEFSAHLVISTETQKALIDMVEGLMKMFP